MKTLIDLLAWVFFFFLGLPMIFLVGYKLTTDSPICEGMTIYEAEKAPCEALLDTYKDKFKGDFNELIKK